MRYKILLTFLATFTLLNANSFHAEKVANKTIKFSNGTVKHGGHRNWRNNNPGNIEYGDFAIANGAIGTDGRFAIFSTMEDGYRAQMNLLSGDSYRNKTIAQAIKRYAPSYENNTNKYISFISDNLGVSKHQKIKHLSRDQRMEMVRLMAEYEGMKAGYYLNGSRYSARVKLPDPATTIRQSRAYFSNVLNPQRTRLHKILIGAY